MSKRSYTQTKLPTTTTTTNTDSPSTTYEATSSQSPRAKKAKKATTEEKGKGKKKTVAVPPKPTNIRTINLTNNEINTEAQEKIKKTLADHGVCTFGPFKNSKWCQESIKEMISHLEGQPRVDEFKIEIPKTEGWTTKEVAKLKKCWVPYVTFGAPSEPPAYHLNCSWQLRQDQQLYDLFVSLYGEKDLRVSIDRYKAKLPGTGEREFCHWDSNPWKWDFKGIFALTDIEFVCVPNTHTEKFFKKFKKEYNGKVNPGPITLLKPENDPMELNKKEEVFKVPAGHFVLWDDKLLHSSYPNKTRDIKFAIYISFTKHVKTFQTDGIRIESFLSGRAPTLQPSGKNFDIMPAAWARFPKKAEEYHRRLPANKREFRTGKDGKKYAIITEHDPESYIPPKLTKLGYKMLWGRERAPTEEDLEKWKHGKLSDAEHEEEAKSNDEIKSRNSDSEENSEDLEEPAEKERKM